MVYNNDKKKVLLLGPSFNAIGGVSTHVRQLLFSDLSKNFELFYFEVGSEGKSKNVFKMILRFLFSPIAFFITIRRKKPHLVHFNSSMNFKAFFRDIIYLYLSKILGLKTIFQIHGGTHFHLFFNSRILSLILKRIMCLPNAVVVLSKLDKTKYERFVSRKALFLIPNAVAVNDYSYKSSKNFNETFLNIVYIGRLVIEKGVLDVIEAIGILRRNEKYFNIKFQIAGSGPDEKIFKKKVLELKLQKEIFFHGPILGLEKIKFWQNAHIFVFPTYSEGLPYTILESLSSGTPILTTRVGGIPDAVEENKQGIFVKPKNPRDIAQTLKKMYSNRGILKKMSENCIFKAYETYNIERLSFQFKELYLKTLR
jgi:glycosyltransferase involved in cell wall biosynthesis